MKRQTLIYLCLLSMAAALPVRADIYKVVAADGSVTFTNVYRPGRNYVRVLRTPKPVKPKAVLTAVAKRPLPAAPCRSIR
ncbi:hypothetical protein D3C78_1590220 [compost metagenome]